MHHDDWNVWIPQQKEVTASKVMQRNRSVHIGKRWIVSFSDEWSVWRFCGALIKAVLRFYHLGRYWYSTRRKTAEVIYPLIRHVDWNAGMIAFMGWPHTNGKVRAVSSKVMNLRRGEHTPRALCRVYRDMWKNVDFTWFNLQQKLI